MIILNVLGGGFDVALLVDYVSYSTGYNAPTFAFATKCKKSEILLNFGGGKGSERFKKSRF